MKKMLSKLREKRAKDDRGFTLIELLVVVVIIGVLIAIAIPLYLNYRKGANDAAAESDMHNAINSLELCNADKKHYPYVANNADLTNPSQTVGDCSQSIALSSGTSMRYIMGSNPAQGDSYTIVSTNSSGSGKFYCYNSARGGGVATVNAPSNGSVTGASQGIC
jgi:type IV pilus assembly protein PilA